MAKAMATDDNAARHGTRPREPGMIRTKDPGAGGRAPRALLCAAVRDGRGPGREVLHVFGLPREARPRDEQRRAGA
ncbi:hypothetical protein SUDANB58_05560 [Streptomyces sp. enrichment culture]